MAKKNTIKKGVIKSKTEKAVIATSKKVSKVDLTNLPDMVDIIGLKDKHLIEGATYNVTREKAIILVSYGRAKLK